MHPRVGNKSTGGSTLSAAADVQRASELLGRIETVELGYYGSRSTARDRLADRLRAAPGTLENIRRLRSKVIPSWLMDRLRAELVAVLAREVRKLEAEIQVHQQAGTRHSDDDLLAAQAQTASLRKFLEGPG